MFENLTSKLGSVFQKLKGRGRLSENDVMAAMREIRIALLEADVALPVVKDFITRIKDKATGQEVLKSITPAQMVVKIVNDELVETLGGKDQEVGLNLKSTPPVAIMMVGLQGSGKTTSTAKIAKRLTDKQKKKVLMASLDVHRPAAQEQLAILGQQTGVTSLPIIAGQTPLEIALRAMETGRKEGYDVVFLDTAGRLSIDEELMLEAANIKKAVNPSEVLLVADAMTGQDAVNVAQNFDEKVGITAIMLTRVDGDARGGAALSMRAITGKPLKYIGVGEQIDGLEEFHPERAAKRILDMGDVVSLVEKAAETIDRDQAAKMAEKFTKGEFDLNDFHAQLQQISKMGGMGGMMKMLPGMGKMKDALDNSKLDDSFLKRQEAIILSMTKKERVNPNVLNASRRRRIAEGSGTSPQEVNKLLKQFQQMQGMMKKVRKMGMGGMMKSLGGMLGGGGLQDLVGAIGKSGGEAPSAEEMRQMEKMMKSGQIDPSLMNLGGTDAGNNPLSGLGPLSGLPFAGKNKKGK